MLQTEGTAVVGVRMTLHDATRAGVAVVVAAVEAVDAAVVEVDIAGNDSPRQTYGSYTRGTVTVPALHTPVATARPPISQRAKLKFPPVPVW